MEKGQGKEKDTLQTDKVSTRKEYIERDAAIAETKPRLTDDELRRRLANIPAADDVPVRHGRWLEHKSWAKCSECGFLIGFETTYCPNCGARMDGDGE